MELYISGIDATVADSYLDGSVFISVAVSGFFFRIQIRIQVLKLHYYLKFWKNFRENIFKILLLKIIFFREKNTNLFSQNTGTKNFKQISKTILNMKNDALWASGSRFRSRIQNWSVYN